MKGRTVLILLIVFILCGYICVASTGNSKERDDPYSGSCGNNLTWSYDKTTYTLTINGTGDMFTSSSSDMPWRSFRSDIKNVVFDGNVTSLCFGAFYRCLSLTNITIPSTMLSIGDSCFYCCESLTSITIPASVSWIAPGSPGNPFVGCSKLSSITVEKGSTAYKDIDGVLFDINGSTLISYPGGRQGDYVIPGSVKSIIREAFMECSLLTSVDIPESVTTIGIYAFNSCKSLVSVTIPKSVSSISLRPFGSCTSLLSIDVDEANPYFKSDDGVLFNKEGTTLLQFPGGKCESYSIPDGVTTIDREAFHGNVLLKSVTIPSSVTTIQQNAFEFCTNLGIVSYLGHSNPGQWSLCLICDRIRAICVPPDYDSDTFCKKSVVCKRDRCNELDDIENHCFQASCINGEWNTEMRKNASEWEAQSNECYEYQCVNTSGGRYELRSNYSEWEKESNQCFEYQCVNGIAESKKRTNASEWEARNNECYDYHCANESGGYYELRDNATEWEKQSNECYIYQCMNGIAESEKRSNATLWESQTNGCIEYQCFNESGFQWWSLCNSSDTIRLTCMNDECVEKEKIDNGNSWRVEIEIDDMKAVDLNVTEVIDEIVVLTGVKKSDVIVGMEVDAQGTVMKIIVFIDNEESANVIAETVNQNEGSGHCQHGVLCRAKRAVVYQVGMKEISRGKSYAQLTIVCQLILLLFPVMMIN